jgi:hypothetical protein
LRILTLMRKTLVLTAILGCLALAATAQAKPLPNNSAVDQYTEGIPTATGERSSRDRGGALPPGTAAPLDSLGKNGAAAAAAAKASAPSRGDAGTSQASGMGIWLWLILLACLLAAVTRYVARRRTHSAAG